MNTIDFSSGADPAGIEAQQLERRRALAELLMSQSVNGGPVYSNKAGIARALQGLMSGMESGSIDRRQKELADESARGRQEELARIVGAAQDPSAPRGQLARLLVQSSNPGISQAGLGMLLKGPEAPLVKETPNGLVVLSPDGMRVLNRIGGAKIAPPSAADVTPESLKAYEDSGDPSVLVPRVKQQAVDTGGGVAFVNPEKPPAYLPKGLSPGETATGARDDARMRFEGITPPPMGGTSIQPTQSEQGARDDTRMKILKQEQADLAAQGKTDPALEREIALIGRQPGLSPKAAGSVAEGTAKELAKGGTDYKIGLDDRVRSGLDLQMRINESRQALSQFTPGMGSETRLSVARAAQALGMPDSVVNKINNGDVAAKQEFMKLSAQQAMESLKQSMGGAGRIAQAEFKVFQANNPNIELDPRAIEKIFDFSQRVLTRDVGEQKAMTDYVRQGGNVSEWPTIWAQQQVRSGLMSGGTKPSNGWSMRPIGG